VSTVYEFTLTLAGVDELTVDLENALFEAGCDDALLHSEGPVVALDFGRKAKSLGKAICSAVEAVEKAGYKVARVQVEETAKAG
jgi:hypothetical protein